uniref:hypothetical protein n=1 Tax=Hymenobacter sp. B1770 TaxID=1718788 RepID=UPI003CEC194B
RVWQQLHPRRVWAVRGDDDLPSPLGACAVDDGDKLVFYFLDKQRIRLVDFYAPAEQQDCGGHEVNRAQALEASRTLRALFPRVR